MLCLVCCSTKDDSKALFLQCFCGQPRVCGSTTVVLGRWGASLLKSSRRQQMIGAVGETDHKKSYATDLQLAMDCLAAENTG